jgi:hypothetical protein
MGWWSKAKARVKKTYSKAKRAVKSAYTRAVKGVGSAINTAKTYVVKAGRGVASVASSATKAIGRGFSSAGSGIKNIASVSYDKIKSWFTPSNNNSISVASDVPMITPNINPPTNPSPSSPTVEVPYYFYPNSSDGTGSSQITGSDYPFYEGASGGYEIGEGSAVDGSLRFGNGEENKPLSTAIISSLLAGAVFFVLA